MCLVPVVVIEMWEAANRPDGIYPVESAKVLTKLREKLQESGPSSVKLHQARLFAGLTRRQTKRNLDPWLVRRSRARGHGCFEVNIPEYKDLLLRFREHVYSQIEPCKKATRPAKPSTEQKAPPSPDQEVAELIRAPEREWETELRQARARIAELEKTVAQLPKKLFWNGIHPKVEREARKRFHSGEYSDGVFRAIQKLEAAVKKLISKKTGEALDGVELMKRAFNREDQTIWIGDVTTKQGWNMQEGYCEMFVAAIRVIRNPNVHELRKLEGAEAERLIQIVSHLYWILEQAIERMRSGRGRKQKQ